MTAYDMRMSDWSSDVCSSDLRNEYACTSTLYVCVCLFIEWLRVVLCAPQKQEYNGVREVTYKAFTFDSKTTPAIAVGLFGFGFITYHRSEERRVGKECVSTCRSRWPRDH